jgi:hypothetical protein
MRVVCLDHFDEVQRGGGAPELVNRDGGTMPDSGNRQTRTFEDFWKAL